MRLRSCVSPEGRFIYGLHQPSYRVPNLRRSDSLCRLGETQDGSAVDNRVNFPVGDIPVGSARPIFEIANAFPFRGATFIDKAAADEKGTDPARYSLKKPGPTSLHESLRGSSMADMDRIFASLPASLRLALGTTSTDPEDLVRLARQACDFVFEDGSDRPAGLAFRMDANGSAKPGIHDHLLYEAVANNPHLPDEYKTVMVLRPGIQGGSEVVGDHRGDETETHVLEYLRRNSYIPWGHYAANFADDCIRYGTHQLSSGDMAGLRHLYYQRTYVRVAAELGIPLPARREQLAPEDLERLRLEIMQKLSTGNHPLAFTSTLWGWNFGFDVAPTLYRLNGAHQQVHQQYAMVPEQVADLPAYACGDLIADFVENYRNETGAHFFDAYLRAIRTNTRMDGDPSRESSLIIHEDQHVMLFVPKAQTSQLELNLMTVCPVGNILEADLETRQALDRALLIASRILAALGARLIAHVEYSKRFTSKSDQRLLYAFIPRQLEFPPFSEAQLRWISYHYPEDFAAVCRAHARPS